MFGPTKQSLFKKAYRNDENSMLFTMLEQVRDLYVNEIKTFFTNTREWNRRAGSKRNVEVMNMYLEHLRTATALLGKVFTGTAKDKDIEQAFSAMARLENDIQSLIEMGKRDQKFSQFLSRQERSGLNVYDFLKVHKHFREYLKTNKIGSANFIEKIKTISPELYGFGEMALSQALIGVLGPAGIPIGFLGKALFGAAMRSQKTRSIQSGYNLSRSLGVTQAQGDYFEGMSSSRGKLGDVFNSMFSAGKGRRGSGSSPYQAPSPGWGSSYRGGMRSSTMVNALNIFWGRDAYKSKYLRELLVAAKGRSWGSGKSGGGDSGLGSFLGGTFLGNGLSKAKLGRSIGVMGLFSRAVVIIASAYGAVKGTLKTLEMFGPKADFLDALASSVAGILNTLSFNLLKIKPIARDLSKIMHKSIPFLKKYTFIGAALSKFFHKEETTKSPSKSSFKKESTKRSSKVSFKEEEGPQIKVTYVPDKKTKTQYGFMIGQTNSKTQKNYEKIVTQLQKESKTFELQKESLYFMAMIQKQKEETKKGKTDAMTVTVPNMNRKISHGADDPFVDRYNNGNVSLEG